MNRPESSYWFARHSKPLVFLILTIAALGGYLAFNIPLAVFPTTNFPRILLAVDNGVMPIDQMMVTITRPLEEAVNSVPDSRNPEPRIREMRSCVPWKRTKVTAAKTNASRPVVTCKYPCKIGSDCKGTARSHIARKNNTTNPDACDRMGNA